MFIYGDSFLTLSDNPLMKISTLIIVLKIEIVNVVATANLNQQLHLGEVGRLQDALYDFDIYPCAYFKHPSMFCKVSVFDSGKMISIGTKKVEQADHDLKYVCKRLIEARMIKPVNIETKIRNMVATVDLGLPIDLEEIAKTFGSTIYEPEHFSGVIWRPSDRRNAILVFASGKLIIAGIRSLSEYKLLSSYLEKTLVPYLICK